MNNLIFGTVLALAAWAGSSSGVFAQTPAPEPEPASSKPPEMALGKLEMVPLGPGPVINRAPDFAKWTITFVYPETGQSRGGQPVTPGSRIQVITMIKTKTIYYQQEIFTDGTRKEFWHVGSLQIEPAPDDKTQMITYTPSSFGGGVADPALYTDYSAGDFPGLDWPSAANYRGVQKTGDKQYLVFEGVASSLFPDLPANSSDALALVDLFTHLPAEIRTSQVTLDYKFEAMPQEVMSLPPAVQQVLQQRAQLFNTLTKRHPSY